MTIRIKPTCKTRMYWSYDSKIWWVNASWSLNLFHLVKLAVLILLKSIYNIELGFSILKSYTNETQSSLVMFSILTICFLQRMASLCLTKNIEIDTCSIVNIHTCILTILTGTVQDFCFLCQNFQQFWTWLGTNYPPHGVGQSGFYPGARGGVLGGVHFLDMTCT